MKLLMKLQRAAFIAATVLSSVVLAAGEQPAWWHSHGHGGGGVTAFGKPGDPKKASRTVNVEMTDDMRYTPSTISVKSGETIRFILKNSGKLRHEMVLGTEGQLEELYHTRMQTPEREYATPSALTVEAGQSGEIIWQFTKLGTVSFACLLPGHYDAGMRGTVIVK